MASLKKSLMTSLARYPPPNPIHIMRSVKAQLSFTRHARSDFAESGVRTGPPVCPLPSSVTSTMTITAVPPLTATSSQPECADSRALSTMHLIAQGTIRQRY
ncbi:hypothetical protein CEXT_173971 [Caerostris extrusa]|uniref:Uncharacterized protein n=1 Tax=Caerostris extrusa TaxID=172846 RepID=A0AAV4R4Y5_CAEEX|nr:hypothetical protein CEXT_173971 [Caerostris extrusa]